MNKVLLLMIFDTNYSQEAVGCSSEQSFREPAQQVSAGHRYLPRRDPNRGYFHLVCSSCLRSLQCLMTCVSHISSILQAVTVYECLSEWGQILCAICPNPKLVITGGTSTVVCVWEMSTSKEKAKTLTLKQVTECEMVDLFHRTRSCSRETEKLP